MSPFAVKCERPQVKICGLTRADEAAACEAAGADAIGCVFFPKSPRCIAADQAAEIRRVLKRSTALVGVFVDAPASDILRIRDRAGIDCAQLHGKESPELIEALAAEGLSVIKTLFANAFPSIKEAEHYPAHAFLVECAGGPLPGGNALAWDWSQAKALGGKYPLVIAGGLTPATVCRAVRASFAEAVDVSSGVEFKPGRKNPAQVAVFIDELARCFVNLPETNRPGRRIFS